MFFRKNIDLSPIQALKKIVFIAGLSSLASFGVFAHVSASPDDPIEQLPDPKAATVAPVQAKAVPSAQSNNEPPVEIEQLPTQ